MTTLSIHKTFAIQSCCVCDVDFAMTDHMTAQRQRDGKSFYCPNGHSQSYTETDATRLKKAQEALARARAAQVHLADQRDAAERSASAYKGQVTKIKKRVGNGVCPCCNRSFQNLHRHMAGQHPEFRDSTA